MQVNDMHIATARHVAALAKFRHKVTVLEELITQRLHQSAPVNLQLRQFVSWEAPELGVEKISSALFFLGTAEHTELRGRAVKALKALEMARIGFASSKSKS